MIHMLFLYMDWYEERSGGTWCKVQLALRVVNPQLADCGVEWGRARVGLEWYLSGTRVGETQRESLPSSYITIATPSEDAKNPYRAKVWASHAISIKWSRTENFVRNSNRVLSELFVYLSLNNCNRFTL